MKRLVLDTNVFIGYVRAARGSAARASFEAFYDVAFARLDFAATVWLELQAGVASPEDQGDLDQLVAPFLEGERMLAPSARAMQQAGRVLGALARRGRMRLERAPAALHHDAILAATVREHGRLLVTENARDFARIQRHLRGFRFVSPFPSEQTL